MTNVIDYKPFSEREVDLQYREMLSHVMQKGKRFESIHGDLKENEGFDDNGSVDVTGYMLRYDLRNGFPLETLRKLGLKGAIAEVVAFLNGARTLEELTSFGVPKVFWEKSLTKEKCGIFGLDEGDMGPGAYGEVLRRMPGPNGKTFDQVLALVNELKTRPNSRTGILSTWYSPLALGDPSQDSPREVVVAPCHGNFIRFKLYPNTKEMHMFMVPRSSDAPVGLMYNIPEWCAMGMMLAYILGYKFTEYVVPVADAQIYNMQRSHVVEMISRWPKALPTVTLDPDGVRENLWDFRPEDFKLSDYHPHPGMQIPTPT